MDLGLRDKIAIVCAASKGLGKASAMALAEEGCKVVICARHQDALDQTASSIRAATGSEVLPIICDLTQTVDIERLVSTTVHEFGTIHILVTNTGHPKMGPFTNLNETDWHTGFEGILLPVIRLCHLIVPLMQKQQWGRIINITSVAVKEPGTPFLLSSVFRTAVAALSKSLANELGVDNILVNTVCPGPFRTPLGEELLRQRAELNCTTLEEAAKVVDAHIPIGRHGAAEELGASIAFIASERASDITGTLLSVDGGMVRSLQ